MCDEPLLTLLLIRLDEIQTVRPEPVEGFRQAQPERKSILLRAEAISIKYASGPITTGVNSYYNCSADKPVWFYALRIQWRGIDVLTGC